MIKPITSVTPIDYYGNVIGEAVTDLPNLSKFEWVLTEIKSSQAGRSEALLYNNMRKGLARAVELEWDIPTYAETASILQAFKSQYVLVTLLDPLIGAYVSKRFTVSDKTVPAFNVLLGRWKGVSFTITQQDADKE